MRARNRVVQAAVVKNNAVEVPGLRGPSVSCPHYVAKSRNRGAQGRSAIVWVQCTVPLCFVSRTCELVKKQRATSLFDHRLGPIHCAPLFLHLET